MAGSDLVENCGGRRGGGAAPQAPPRLPFSPFPSPPLPSAPLPSRGPAAEPGVRPLSARPGPRPQPRPRPLGGSRPALPALGAPRALPPLGLPPGSVPPGPGRAPARGRVRSSPGAPRRGPALPGGLRQNPANPGPCAALPPRPAARSRFRSLGAQRGLFPRPRFLCSVRARPFRALFAFSGAPLLAAAPLVRSAPQFGPRAFGASVPASAARCEGIGERGALRRSLGGSGGKRATLSLLRRKSATRSRRRALVSTPISFPPPRHPPSCPRNGELLANAWLETTNERTL